MTVLIDWEGGDDAQSPTSGEATSGTRARPRAGEADICRTCRGRGYDRRNPDEPCRTCDGEGEQPTW